MRFWRIYRLPGSRQVWHIDTGENTPIINVRSFSIDCVSASSVDIGNGFLRAWIEIPFGSTELYIIQGVAIWRSVAVSVALAADVPERVTPVPPAE